MTEIVAEEESVPEDSDSYGRLDALLDMSALLLYAAGVDFSNLSEEDYNQLSFGAVWHMACVNTHLRLEVAKEAIRIVMDKPECDWYGNEGRKRTIRGILRCAVRFLTTLESERVDNNAPVEHSTQEFNT